MATTTVIKASKQETASIDGIVTNKLRVAAYARVSTDDEEQAKSYQTQMDYYTDKITSNPNWVFAGIYSDEAITGTKADKRPGFLKMIDEAVKGNIDTIMTKSISRFARNTVDTLQYVRLLKQHNVAVIFEEENINTSTMDGELLLTILSSVAQQEVQNISEHVKHTVKNKMINGKMVGAYECYGYRYNKQTGNLEIEEGEALVVRHIFELASKGYGAKMIANDLTDRGIPTIKGNNSWNSGTIEKMLRNVKYVGDLKSNNTYTADPISKKRIVNHGEKEKYYTKNHHPAIIDRDLFDSIQMKMMSYKERKKYSIKKYTFSGKLKCGFCDASLSQKTNNVNSINPVSTWWCITANKKGTTSCPNSKRIPESVLEDIFVEMFNKIKNCGEDDGELFYKNVEKCLKNDTSYDEIQRLKAQVNKYNSDIEKLTEMRLLNQIDIDTFERMYNKIKKKKDFTDEKLNEITNRNSLHSEIKARMADFKNTINENDLLAEFNADLFETLVDKIIVGGYDDNEEVDPYKITIVLKGGVGNTGISQQPILTFKSDVQFFSFILINGGRKKAVVSDLDVKVVFSNEKINEVTPEIIQKKLLFEHKDFMGDKNIKTISDELGVSKSIVSSCKSRILK